jgi:hypothetical protein
MCDLCDSSGTLPKGRAAPARTSGVIKQLIGNVAFWQGMGFVMLVSLVWVNETLDLTHLLFQRQSTLNDWLGASVLTAGILIIAFVTMAHTYVLQRRILEGIIIVCSYCSKVKIEETNWERMELFLAGKTRARFSHGICPACYHDLQRAMAEEAAEPAAPPAKERAKEAAPVPTPALSTVRRPPALVAAAKLAG